MGGNLKGYKVITTVISISLLSLWLPNLKSYVFHFCEKISGSEECSKWPGVTQQMDVGVRAHNCCFLPLQSALSPPMYRAPSVSAAMPVNAIPVGLNLCQQCGGSLLKKKEDSWREAEEND